MVERGQDRWRQVSQDRHRMLFEGDDHEISVAQFLFPFLKAIDEVLMTPMYAIKNANGGDGRSEPIGRKRLDPAENPQR